MQRHKFGKGKRMAFFKKVFKQLNKKWYPQSVLVGNTVTTDQIARLCFSL